MCPSSWWHLGVSRPLPLQPPYRFLLASLPFRFTPKQAVRGTLKWRQRQIWKEWVSSVKRCLFIVAIPQSRLASGLRGTPPPVASWQPGTSRALSRRHRLSSNALKGLHVKRTKQEHLSSRPRCRDINANVAKFKGSPFKTRLDSVWGSHPTLG